MGSSASSSNRFPEIEKYDLVEEIGHGGMATVYRAIDRRLDRQVAVKVIHKHLRENQEVRRRFVSEAKAVAKLRHNGIVEVYDVSDQEDIERYLVVELITGMSLRQLLEDRRCLPAEVAATLLANICDAVDHAHSQGVIHRDIKPENVLLEVPDATVSDPTASDASDSQADTSADPQAGGSQTRKRREATESSAGGSGRGSRARVIVKLTDFGIAKLLDVQGVTSTGQILGSPAHMAPEQIEGGAVGAHTDVFALGVLMYECMVGHLPFEGRNPAQVLRRVLEGDYEPADSERAVVGGRWAKIIASALAHNIEDRLTSAGDLGNLIEEELENLGIADPWADLIDYFLDERAYSSRTADLLVPRLLARGEFERRAGRIPEAASDFNRALALRPDDLSIVKRIVKLNAQTVWKERALRTGGILLGSLALGGAAFGVTKLVKSAETVLPAASNAVAPVDSTTSPGPEFAPPIRRDPILPVPARPAPSATPQTSASSGPAPVVGPAPAAVPGPSASVSPPGTGVTRTVVFRVWPNHVKLSVGGQNTANNGRLTLPAGSYTVSATDKCCRPYAGALTVHEPHADRPNKLQIATVRLELKQATVALGGAPAGATLACSGVGLVVAANSSASVAIDSPSMTTQCIFSPGGKPASVMLVAGGHTSVQWPK